ncbi:hypothetical protein DMENIID0001_141250 [Sergentomyia squamirostris]
MDTTQKMTCGACGKHVNYVSEFVFHYQNDHMDLVNNKAIIKCINPSCSSSFTRINDLKKHLKKGHCIENVPMHPDGSRKRKYSDIESTSASEFPENRDCGPSKDLNEDENISTSHETGEIEKLPLDYKKNKMIFWQKILMIMKAIIIFKTIYHLVSRHWYSNYTNVVYQRNQRKSPVVDLYLCPRAHGMKLTIEPEYLIPKLSSPKDLQPFPTHETLFYVGHSDIVWTVSVEP